MCSFFCLFVNFNLSPLCIEKYFLRCFLSAVFFLVLSAVFIYWYVFVVCCRVSFEPLLFIFIIIFEFCSCGLKVLRFMRVFSRRLSLRRILVSYLPRSPSHLHSVAVIIVMATPALAAICVNTTVKVCDR